MEHFEKCLISTILYCNFLDRPLTSVELFKFFNCAGFQSSLSFGKFLAQIEQSKELSSLIQESRGFYFLKDGNPAKLFSQRQKSGKISQKKWKKIIKVAKLLQISPFLEMLGVTGSLSLDNAHEQSDFDFLIVLKPGRLWIGRLFITLILSLLGWRRHGKNTKDRVCLNCYLAAQNLAIETQIKPHDLHSAHEYSRLVPIFEKESGIFSRFQSSNDWIAGFIANYPWPNEINLKTPSLSPWLAAARKPIEFLLSGSSGEWLEKRLGQWQIKRIKRKIALQSPADQIYFSNETLMFHPKSKSIEILNKHALKLQKLTD